MRNIKKYLFIILLSSLEFFKGQCVTAEVLQEQIVYRMPSLQQVQVRQLLNGPESFTPDGMPILGQSPEVSHIW